MSEPKSMKVSGSATARPMASAPTKHEYNIEIPFPDEVKGGHVILCPTPTPIPKQLVGSSFPLRTSEGELMAGVVFLEDSLRIKASKYFDTHTNVVANVRYAY